MIQKIREKLNIQTVIRLIPTVLFLLFIFYMMIHTYTGKVKSAVTDIKISVESLEKLSDSFEETLRDNIYDKYGYFDLNGWCTKMLGINSLNERQKLANGYLSTFDEILDINYASSSVIDLSEFLKTRDIEFIYILLPCHASFYDVSFAPGYGSESWQNIEAMISSLNDADVNCIDMNAWFEENGWTMEDVFYKTDHHCLPSVGLQEAKLTMSYLSQKGLVLYDSKCLEEENWEIKTLKNWSLGSNGKRTGSLYAGVDDFPIYVPKYATDYKYFYLKSHTTNWTYTDSLLDLTYAKRKELYTDNVDKIYLGTEYPIRIINNSKAVNDKKILIIGDSNKRPYEYFLSTQFKEIYGLDLRFYADGTLAQYIEEIHPDFVVMCTAVTQVSDKRLYTFGVNDYVNELGETDMNTFVYCIESTLIEARLDNSDNFQVLYSNLEPNQTYTLTIDSNQYTGGEDLYIQMTLQDLNSNESIYNRYFDANSDETQKWIFTTPDDIAGEYSIYLYAGTKGHTKDVSVGVSNVKLRKGVFED